MKTLNYFYEEYLKTFVDFLEEVWEVTIEIFSRIISWFLAAVLFLSLPLWIIPFKLWKRKEGDDRWKKNTENQP